MFVPLVENGYLNGPATEIIAKEYLLPLKQSGIDTLILGCTHYPLLRPVIQTIMGDAVTLIDAGAETAVFVKQQLYERDLLCGRGHGSAQYFVSDTVEGFTELAGMFLNQKLEGSVHTVNIESY